jgi:hypothetical protein
MEDNEQLRWEKIDPVYKKIIDEVYSHELTGGEIDTLINLVWSKITRDKLVTVVYFDVKNMLAMDAVTKNITDKKPDIPYIG